MFPVPAAGATLLLGALLGFCVYDFGSSDGHLVRMMRKQGGSFSARPFLGEPSFDANLTSSAPLDLDRPRLLPTLRTLCPLEYQRPTLEELRSRRVRPYLFGGNQRPVCTQCHASGAARGRMEEAAYIMWPGRRVCPYEDQEALLQHFLDLAGNGSRWAENMLRLTPCDLWPFLRGRTLWLLGDSITQETMIAMENFFLEWWEPTQDNPMGRTPLTNNTEAVKRATKEGGVGPWCVPLLGQGRICHFRSNMGTDWGRHVLPEFPAMGALPSDILVANFAVWINNDTEYRVNLRAFTDHFEAPNVRARLPFFIWRDASVQHFQTHTGDYIGAEWPFECMPIGGHPGAVKLHPDGTLATDDPELQVVLEGGWRNKIASPIMEAMGVPIMRTWNQTVPLWSDHHDYHPGNPHPDCTHSCHPYYAFWIYHLYETLLASQTQLLQHASAGGSPRHAPAR